MEAKDKGSWSHEAWWGGCGETQQVSRVALIPEAYQIRQLAWAGRREPRSKRGRECAWSGLSRRKVAGGPSHHPRLQGTSKELAKRPCFPQQKAVLSNDCSWWERQTLQSQAAGGDSQGSSTFHVGILGKLLSISEPQHLPSTKSKVHDTSRVGWGEEWDQACKVSGARQVHSKCSQALDFISQRHPRDARKPGSVSVFSIHKLKCRS